MSLKVYFWVSVSLAVQLKINGSDLNFPVGQESFTENVGYIYTGVVLIYRETGRPVWEIFKLGLSGVIDLWETVGNWKHKESIWREMNDCFHCAVCFWCWVVRINFSSWFLKCWLLSSVCSQFLVLNLSGVYHSQNDNVNAGGLSDVYVVCSHLLNDMMLLLRINCENSRFCRRVELSG